MKHVALLIPGLDRLGGAERQVISLACGLLSRNWRVTVVALSGNGGDAAEGLKAAGAEFLTLAMRKGLADPRGWIRFHRWIVREAPDIVHAHLPHAAWLARWSRLWAPVPVLIDSIHTAATGPLGRRIGYRASDWLPDRVAAVSGGVAEAYRSAGMVSARRLLIVPNGVDVEHWQPNQAGRFAQRQRLGLDGEFLWFAAGRLDPVKDYPALLRAMMEVPAPAHLVIAGGGPGEGDLRRMAMQCGIESRVSFLGFVPDVRPWMQAADGFVLASRWEGLPMSLLEAGACGLPAVATDVAGSREIVLEGQTGFLVKAADPSALCGAMKRMMRLAPEGRARMAAQARCHVVARFSLDVVLDRWESIYRGLLEQHPPRSRWGSGVH